MATVRITLEGEPETISLRSFLAAIQNSVNILGDLDVAISGNAKGSLDWVVSDLSTGSLVVEVESRSRLPEKNVGPSVAQAFVEGMSRIQNEGASPLTSPRMGCAAHEAC